MRVRRAQRYGTGASFVEERAPVARPAEAVMAERLDVIGEMKGRSPARKT